MAILLASRSPRRRELLARLEVAFEAVDVDVAEVPGADERAEDYVRRVARAKARSARQQTAAAGPVLAADTEVVLDGRVLGKPGTVEEGVAMLLSLSGRPHQVMTAVVLLDRSEREAFSRSTVWFEELRPAACRDYCLACRPLDKAGGYGIQDRASAFIRRFEGSYSGVMGLPLKETAGLLKEFGVRVSVPTGGDRAGNWLL